MFHYSLLLCSFNFFFTLYIPLKVLLYLYITFLKSSFPLNYTFQYIYLSKILQITANLHAYIYFF